MTKTGYTIGMIVPTVDNSFFSGLVSSLERFLEEKDSFLITLSSNNDPKTELQCMKLLSSLKVSGIISVSSLARLEEDKTYNDIPMVWIDKVPASGREIPWVSNDDVSAMETATEYLIEKGCRNILLLPGYITKGAESPRVSGYRNALTKNGIPFREDYILNRPGLDSSQKESAMLVSQAIKENKDIDGIITSSDRAAFGAIRALQKIEYFVPEDIRIISFDNSPYTAMASPSITALDRKPDLLAKRACELLFDQLEGREAELENIIEVTLVERGSSR